jgi:hypothetical protein
MREWRRSGLAKRNSCWERVRRSCGQGSAFSLLGEGSWRYRSFWAFELYPLGVMGALVLIGGLPFGLTVVCVSETPAQRANPDGPRPTSSVPPSAPPPRPPRPPRPRPPPRHPGRALAPTLPKSPICKHMKPYIITIACRFRRQRGTACRDDQCRRQPHARSLGYFWRHLSAPQALGSVRVRRARTFPPNCSSILRRRLFTSRATRSLFGQQVDSERLEIRLRESLGVKSHWDPARTRPTAPMRAAHPTPCGSSCSIVMSLICDGIYTSLSPPDPERRIWNPQLF